MMPISIQMQLHQQMLFRQQQIHRRNNLEDAINPSAWRVPTLGEGPPLSLEVKVELVNRPLWEEFHAQTTEMVITKVGRRMFPSIQLSVEGLERRARYCVLLEVEPASDRRHKYVGGGLNKDCENARGWISAGPAEPQPRIDRRIYLHPDSPATGAHWMQHPLNFNKLKLTNNAADPRNNVVLTSMHKYIPRIWIVRCDDATRLTDLYSYPASSFTFRETEFIAVTAYQNDNITKLKIDNNPFAKGFRETGQSRCKRKFQTVTTQRGLVVVPIEDDDDEETASSEVDSNRPSSHSDVASQRPTTASSETGSLDDMLFVSSERVSPPLPSIVRQNSPQRDSVDAQPKKLHRPWVDSGQRYLPFTRATPPSSSFTSRFVDFSLPYYYQLFPSFATHPDFMRIPYQPAAQYAKHH